MPELPEVETVMRGLAPVMAGARIERVELRRADLRFPFPERFAQQLEGRRVERFERRAKYMLAHIEGGETLLMHLGMTGRFLIEIPARARASKKPGRTGPGAFVHQGGGVGKHDHVVFWLSNGATVTYNDARRFGYMMLIAEGETSTHPLLANLGIEPLGNELSGAYLAQRAAGRSIDLKAFLMDQRIVCGLGNIYVCEALHRAALAPTRRAATLADRRGRPTGAAEALARTIRAVLHEAITAGGSTLRNYQRTDGSLGYFQHCFAVYGREGRPCLRDGCGGHVRRRVQVGRSTFHCARCQR